MANTSLAVLESALRVHKLDRTLTTALPPLERTDPSALLPTNVETLDACLRGGLPRGHLSEIAGPSSSGRTTLLLQLLAAATRRGEIAALVDTFDRLDVASALTMDVEAPRLLWIRGQAVTQCLPERLGAVPYRQPALDSRWVPGEDAGGRFETPRVGLLERAVDRALKALNLVLQAGGFGLVALDLADVPPAALRRIPYTTWLRVQRAIEGSDTACVLVAPAPLARSAGGLTLTLGGRMEWAGESSRSRRIAGLDVSVRVVSPRRRMGREGQGEGEARVRCRLRG